MDEDTMPLIVGMVICFVAPVALIGFGFIGRAILRPKGYSGWLGFVLGAVGGIIGIIIALVLPKSAPPAAQPAAASPVGVSQPQSSASSPADPMAERIEKLKASGDVEQLIQLFQQRQPDLIERATRQALREIGEPAIAPLIAALGHQNYWVRDMAAMTLVDMGAPVVEPLIAAFDNQNPEVRNHVITILGAIKDARVLPALITALKDPYWGVRFAAVGGLGSSGDMRAIELLRAAREAETEGSVCKAIDEALKKLEVSLSASPTSEGVAVESDQVPSPSAAGAMEQDSPGERWELQKLLTQSLDARTFVEATKRLGFTFVSENFMGLTMESSKGRYMLAILQSVHPTNIAVLVYSDKHTGENTTLVNEGKRQF